MRLLAIYNVWGDCLELLAGSIKSIRDVVDGVIIVAQEESNRGETDRGVYPFCNNLIDLGLVDRVISFIPDGKNAYRNERNKRQIGIEFAKDHGYTHFLHMDADEYYIEEDFERAKRTIELNNYKGTFIDLWTYYKEPTLRLSKKEGYCVPFIHEVLKNSNCGKHNMQNYKSLVDPTRAISIPSVHLKNVEMHHFSYVRQNISKKLRNSTASKLQHNREAILKEYNQAEKGTHLKTLFNDHLVRVENIFNIDISEYGKVKA